jgi:hypothetical protein
LQIQVLLCCAHGVGSVEWWQNRVLWHSHALQVDALGKAFGATLQKLDATAVTNWEFEIVPEVLWAALPKLHIVNVWRP